MVHCICIFVRTYFITIYKLIKLGKSSFCDPDKFPISNRILIQHNTFITACKILYNLQRKRCIVYMFFLYKKYESILNTHSLIIFNTCL